MTDPVVTPRKLFIVGAPRSGTSLVRDLINHSPDVALLEDELQILPQLIKLAQDGAEWQKIETLLRSSAYGARRIEQGRWPQPEAFEEALGGRRGRDLLDALFVLLSAEDSRTTISFFGEKTPENIFALQEIARMWPNSFFLFIIRDPRATVFSMKRSWGRSVVRGAEIWRKASQIASEWIASAPAGSCHSIRYEKLLRNPHGELSKAFKRLGVAADFSGIDAPAKSDQWSPSRRANGVASDDSNWRQALPRQDWLLIEQLVYDEMIRDGYEPEIAASKRSVGRVRFAFAHLGDAVRVLRSYVASKGLVGGVSYKLRQWSKRYLVSR